MPLYVPPPDLLPARVVNELGYTAAELYAGLEARVTARVAALVSEGMEVPGDLITRQRTLAQLRAAAQDAIDRIDPDMAADFVRIAAEAGSRAALNQLRVIPGLDPESLLNVGSANAIAALALDLTNRLEALEQRILRYPQDAYQRLAAWTAPDILAGTAGLLRTQQLLASRFLAEGIAGFVDVSGRHWSIGTYAEMATRTAVMRAWQDGAVGTMQAAGINLVTVVMGNTACEKCGAWSGRVLSTDGTPAGTYDMPHAIDEHLVRVRVDGTVDEARAAGFQHPNCRCALVAYLPGLTLAGAATSYDAEQEATLVRQRELERKVRAAKRRLAATTDPDKVSGLQQRVEDAQEAVREHLDATGLHRRRYREQLWFVDGHPPVESSGPPVTYRRGATPTREERATYERLAALGHDVTVLAAQRSASGLHAPTPDLFMDGGLWEVKTLTSSASNKLSDRVRQAAAQSERAVFDLTESKLDNGTALERIAHDADRYGLGEARLVRSDQEWHLHGGEWARRR